MLNPAEERYKQVLEYITKIAVFSAAISKQENRSEQDAISYCTHAMACACNYIKIIPNQVLADMMKVSMQAAMITQYGQKPQFMQTQPLPDNDIKDSLS